MAKTPATYYVRIDTLWQNSPDWWVGPFASEGEAQAEIDRALNDQKSACVMAGRLAGDVKHAIRIFGIVPKSQAIRKGLKAYSLGDNYNNTLGKFIPLSTDDLAEMETN